MDPHSNRPATPFLKWAGGKRWLLEARPELFKVKFNRYIEPFLGSGSVFFNLAPECALLGDSNADLIEVFCVIQQQWAKVVNRLRWHHKRHNTDHFYKMRLSRPESPVGRAARFIYLNRTCWNGLYRVNKKGAFNVPIGTKSNVFSEAEDFGRYSRILSRATLRHADFEYLVDEAGEGDFVFIDPPYTVRHNLNGFLKYNEVLFTWTDQMRLRDAVVRAVKRGAKILVTNAAHISVVDLYADVGEIISIQRSSVIAAKREFRGSYNEIVIRC